MVNRQLARDEDRTASVVYGINPVNPINLWFKLIEHGTC